MSQLGDKLGYPIQAIHVPKTMDNDLPLTDTCPGFGSVAKYTAVSIREAGFDVRSMAKTSTNVFILEVMGRHAGWTAAAGGLAAERPGDAPQVILFPEIVFDEAKFLAAVAASVKAHGFCAIVASEGLRVPSGQFLSETGAVGLVLFLVAGLALARAARRPTDPELALAFALPAYLLHGLVDIDWDFAAVSAPVFLIAGSLVVKPIELPRRSFSAGLAAAGVALAAVSSLFAVWLGNRWTGQAEDALGSHNARAVTLAKRARSVQPLSVEPIFVQALAEQLERHYGQTLGLLRKATRLQPENKETWFALGEFDFRVRHCPRIALRELNRFTELDRQDPGNAEYARALKQVNSGKPTC